MVRYDPDVMATCARRCLILIVSLLGGASSETAYSQCGDPSAVAVRIDLVSLPYEGIPTVLRVSDYYPSGAMIGTAHVTVTGTEIRVTQTNDVAPTLPTVACRVQLLNLGILPVGKYDVTWTTTENITIPFPATNTRTRTLVFEILPAAAIPTASARVLLLFGMTVAALGVCTLR